jgi:hypothetical protein
MGTNPNEKKKDPVLAGWVGVRGSKSFSVMDIYLLYVDI